MKLRRGMKHLLIGTVLMVAAYWVATTIASSAQDPLQEPLNALKKKANAVFIDPNFRQNPILAVIRTEEPPADRLVDLYRAEDRVLLGRLEDEIKIFRDQIQAALIERNREIDRRLEIEKKKFTEKKKLTDSEIEVLAVKKSAEIEKEIYEPFANVLDQYTNQILYRLYLNYFRNAHVPNRVVGTFRPDYYDHLSLIVDSRFARYISSNDEQNLLYRMWHVPSADGLSYDAIEIGITPNDKALLEFFALQELDDQMGFAKRIHFQVLRNRILNRSALLRLTPGLVPDRLPDTCGPNFISLQPHQPRHATLAKRSYAEWVTRSDQYHENALAILLIHSGFESQFFLNRDDLKTVLTSFAKANEDMSFEVETRADTEEKAWNDFAEEKATEILATFAEKWKANQTGQKMLQTASFPSDDFDSKRIGLRYANAIREYQEVYLAMYLAKLAKQYTPVTEAPAEAAPAAPPSVPVAQPEKSTAEYARAMALLKALPKDKIQRWNRDVSLFVDSRLKSTEVQFVTTALRESRQQEAFQKILPNLKAAAEINIVSREIDDKSDDAIRKILAKGEDFPSATALTSKQALVAAGNHLDSRYFALTADQLKTYFQLKLAYWAGQSNDIGPLTAIANDILNEPSVMEAMDGVFSELSTTKMMVDLVNANSGQAKGDQRAIQVGVNSNQMMPPMASTIQQPLLTYDSVAVALRGAYENYIYGLNGGKLLHSDQIHNQPKVFDFLNFALDSVQSQTAKDIYNLAETNFSSPQSEAELEDSVKADLEKIQADSAVAANDSLIIRNDSLSNDSLNNPEFARFSKNRLDSIPKDQTGRSPGIGSSLRYNEAQNVSNRVDVPARERKKKLMLEAIAVLGLSESVANYKPKPIAPKTVKEKTGDRDYVTGKEGTREFTSITSKIDSFSQLEQFLNRQYAEKYTERKVFRSLFDLKLLEVAIGNEAYQTFDFLNQFPNEDGQTLLDLMVKGEFVRKPSLNPFTSERKQADIKISLNSISPEILSSGLFPAIQSNAVFQENIQINDSLEKSMQMGFKSWDPAMLTGFTKTRTLARLKTLLQEKHKIDPSTLAKERDAQFKSTGSENIDQKVKLASYSWMYRFKTMEAYQTYQNKLVKRNIGFALAWKETEAAFLDFNREQFGPLPYWLYFRNFSDSVNIAARRSNPGLVEEACLANPAIQGDVRFANIFRSSPALRNQLTQQSDQMKEHEAYWIEATKSPIQKKNEFYHEVGMWFLYAILMFVPVGGLALAGGIFGRVALGSFSAGMKALFAGLMPSFLPKLIAKIPASVLTGLAAKSVGAHAGFVFNGLLQFFFVAQIVVSHQFVYGQLHPEIAYQFRVYNSHIGTVGGIPGINRTLTGQDIQKLQAEITGGLMGIVIGGALQAAFMVPLAKQIYKMSGYFAKDQLAKLAAEEGAAELIAQIQRKKLTDYIAVHGKTKGNLLYWQENVKQWIRYGRITPLNAKASIQKIREIFGPSVLKYYKNPQNLEKAFEAKIAEISEKMALNIARAEGNLMVHFSRASGSVKLNANAFARLQQLATNRGLNSTRWDIIYSEEVFKQILKSDKVEYTLDAVTESFVKVMISKPGALSEAGEAAAQKIGGQLARDGGRTAIKEVEESGVEQISSVYQDFRKSLGDWVQSSSKDGASPELTSALIHYGYSEKLILEKFQYELMLSALRGSIEKGFGGNPAKVIQHFCENLGEAEWALFREFLEESLKMQANTVLGQGVFYFTKGTEEVNSLKAAIRSYDYLAKDAGLIAIDPALKKQTVQLWFEEGALDLTQVVKANPTVKEGEINIESLVAQRDKIIQKMHELENEEVYVQAKNYIGSGKVIPKEKSTRFENLSKRIQLTEEELEKLSKNLKQVQDWIDLLTATRSEVAAKLAELSPKISRINSLSAQLDQKRIRLNESLSGARIKNKVASLEEEMKTLEKLRNKEDSMQEIARIRNEIKAIQKGSMEKVFALENEIQNLPASQSAKISAIRKKSDQIVEQSANSIASLEKKIQNLQNGPGERIAALKKEIEALQKSEVDLSISLQQEITKLENQLATERNGINIEMGEPGFVTDQSGQQEMLRRIELRAQIKTAAIRTEDATTELNQLTTKRNVSARDLEIAKKRVEYYQSIQTELEKRLEALEKSFFTGN